MTKETLGLLHFAPRLKSVLWGGSRLARYKGMSGSADPVGESWEISGVPGLESVVDRGRFRGMSIGELVERHGPELLGHRVAAACGNQFPLLVKFIDAGADLSVQVHPDDVTAGRDHGCRGKTELWYVIDRRPGARVLSGLSRDITLAEFDTLVADDRLLDVIESHPTAPGDIFFIPAGRVHAIGAGNLLVEIQQASDVTYRIHDYNRRDTDGNLRPLHIDRARRVVDLCRRDDYRLSPVDLGDGVARLAECDYFKAYRLDSVEAEARLLPVEQDSFGIAVCIDGRATLTPVAGESESIAAGDTLLVPACSGPVEVTGDATIIVATC